jgi:hypothetical protein
MSTTTCEGATWVEASATTPTAAKIIGFKKDISIISWECNEVRGIRTPDYHHKSDPRRQGSLL